MNITKEHFKKRANKFVEQFIPNNQTGSKSPFTPPQDPLPKRFETEILSVIMEKNNNITITFKCYRKLGEKN